MSNLTISPDNGRLTMKGSGKELVRNYRLQLKLILITYRITYIKCIYNP
jgi:hypothetical protein